MSNYFAENIFQVSSFLDVCGVLERRFVSLKEPYYSSNVVILQYSVGVDSNISVDETFAAGK